jgi:rod shape determining protein RodA
LGLFVSTDYRHIARLSTPTYFVMLGLLLLVLLLGTTVRGTLGWINLGFAKVQPVELAKLTLIIFLASFFAKKRTELGDFSRLFASLVLAGIMVFLVLLQPDLGSALVLIGIWAGMILIAGLRWSQFFLLIGLGLMLVGASWFFLAPYQKDRIMNVFEPKADTRGSGYNVLQAMVSVGSGGLMGTGIGHGSQAQLNFLPEKHTDFIFATLTEELGLVGAVFILLMYGVLLYRIWRIGVGAQDNFGYLACSGVFFFFLIQIVVNVGMNIGLLPVTGIPLPLVSYGGSSLVAMLAAIGLVLNVHLKSQEVVLSRL